VVLDHSDTTKFVLLTTQRTGSTWVRTSLNSHPEIASYGELFLERGQGFPFNAAFAPLDVEFFESWLAMRARGPHPVSRARLCLTYLNHLYYRGRTESIVGFKLMYSQVRRNPALIGYLLAKRIRILHLIRRNLLDVVISAAAAQARGQAHAAGKDPVREIQIRLDPQATRHRLIQLERQVTFVRGAIRASRLPAHEMTYEDLLSDGSKFDDAARFLGVDASPGQTLTSALKKLNRKPQRQIVANWTEVERNLRAAGFAGYLQDATDHSIG
jgi:LPS sulfotransferase NodH